MSRLSYKTLFSILFFVLIGIVLLQKITSIPSQKVEAGWFDDTYSYRQRIDITNSNGSTLANQRVKVTFDTSAIIPSKMQTNCNDIRITDMNGKLLDHWKTGCNTSSTYIYVTIPSIPSSGTSLFLYYGNPNAPNIEKKLGTADNPGTSCKMMKDQGSVTSDGPYYIVPGGNDSDKIQVYCDVTTLSEGWSLVLQNNSAITTNPEPVWSDAVNSVNTTGVFGSSLTAFDLILGLKHWNYLGSTALVQIGTAPTSITKRATYSSISLNAGNNYALSLGTETLYLGAATPGIKSYSAANNYQFSTSDADHDVYAGNCANSYGGSPWWYGACWSGSYWGGGDSGSYQNAPFWVGSSSDYNSYGAIYIGGNDTMKNTTAAAPTSEEKSPAPVAYWKFDEGVGTTAYDSTANANNGLLATGTSAPTWQTEDMCISGKCLKFNGSSNYISIADNSNLEGMSQLTQEAWVNMKSFSGSPVVMGKVGSYDLYFNTGGTLYTDYKSANGGTVPLNTWTHIAMTYDGSNTRLYVNGIQTAIQANSGDIGTSNTPIEIGRWASSEYVNGLIDEPKIYSYARTAAQIKTDYNSGKAHAVSAKGAGVALGNNNKSSDGLSNGLVGYWKMDENVGTTTLDASGNNNTATFGTGNSAPSWSGGKYGVGLSLSGTNQYLSLGTTVLPTGGSALNNFSVSMWANSTDFTNNHIFLIQQASTPRVGDFYVFSDNTSLYFSRYTGSGNNGDQIGIPVSAISSSTWHHFVFTWSGGSSGNRHIFVDNVDIAGTNASGNLGNFGNVPNTSFGGPFANYYFKGLMDEVRIYNRALTSNEVSSLYNWAPGPIGYWNMEEGIGTTAYDKSGNSLNAGWTGTGSHWSVGKFGAAANLNGTDDYLFAADNSLLNPTNTITVEAWFKTPAISSQSYPPIVKKADATAGYSLEINHSNNNLNLWAYIAGGWRSSPSYALSLNTWYHAVGVYDGSYLRLFVNGVEVTSPTAQSGSLVAATNPLNIGRDPSNPTRFFKGVVDEVRVYNYPRTQKQITEDMNASHPAGGSPVGSQIGYWKFDEGQGTTVNNSGSAGSTFNGTLGTGNSAPTWTNDGKFSKALSFSGTNQYVSIPSVNPPNYVTVGAWFKRNGTPGSGYHIIYTQGTQIEISIPESTGQIRTGVTTATLGRQVFNSGSGLVDGNWHYVALTYDGSYLNSYIDGRQTASNPVTGALSTGSATTIGYLSGGYSTNGLIDEVKIYNSALTADEIKLDYNHGLATQIGSFSSGTGNTAPSTASSQLYCVPGDTATCPPPIGEWNFEEGVGTSTLDTSGNNYTGILQNTPSRITGKTGFGLGFDGSANHQYVGTSLPISPASYTSLTITAWVNPSANATSYDSVLAGDDGGWDRGFGINTATYEVQRGNGTWQPGATIDIGQWQFIALVYSPSQITFYKNGVSYNYGSGGVFGSSTQPLLMSADIPCGECYFNGKLDNVKVYGYARTPAQVALDYNRGGPVGWWKLDECQGSIAYDSSGVGNTGAISIGASGTQNSLGTCAVGTSAAWTNGTSGKYNSSLNFDGTDDYVNIGTSASQPIGQKPRTLSAWIKPVNTNPGGVVVSQNNAGGGSQSFMIDIATISGTTYLFTDGINSNNNITITGSQIPSSNNWHHIVFVFDGGTAWSYYLDGTLAKNGNFVTTINTVPDNISIGRRGDGANTGTYFPGQIDDVRIFNYALTSTQVKSLYSAGTAVNFAPASGAP